MPQSSKHPPRRRVPPSQPTAAPSPYSPQADPTKPPPVHLLPVELIDAHPQNPREPFSAEEVRDLEGSISRICLLHPIHVQIMPGGRFRVMSGERRLAAVRLRGWSRIPSFKHSLSNEEALRWMVEENLHRRQLSPIETARAIELMKTLGEKNTAIGKVCNLASSGAVTNKHKLLRLPQRWQQMVHRRELGERMGRLIVSEVIDAGRPGDLPAIEAALNANRKKWLDDGVEGFGDQLRSTLAALVHGRLPRQRLIVDLAASTVMLDGESFEVTGAQALLFSKLKEQKPGVWYDAKRCGIERRSRVTKKLTPKLKATIESQGGLGCRLFPEFL